MNVATHIGKRIREARAHRTQADFAALLKISINTLRAYERGERMPGADTISKVAAVTGLSADWLLSDFLPQDQINTDNQHPVFGDRSILPRPLSWKVPLLAFAVCSIDGWYNVESLGINMPVPAAYPYVPELIAVIAKGTSMIPDGIREGYILFCDPERKPVPDNAVFIVRRTNSASVKLFLGYKGDKVLLKGWLPPDENGDQTPYFEEALASEIKTLAPVVLVARDLWRD